MSDEPLVLALPFHGRWRARNSPADRVPSHGSHLFGTTYAIDFVQVDPRGRTAPRGWRSVVATEPPERFLGYGAPLLAPLDGTVVAVHDGEPDHAAYRSPVAGSLYLLTQAARARRGAGAVAGNHVVVAAGPTGPFVLLAHLRLGSPRVEEGDDVRRGQVVGHCGSSGNSTEPHVHVQATDTLDWPTTRGLPIAFGLADGSVGVPANGDVVDAG